jgi:CMP-N,N'-diacetyllegionaminic acid synthase
LINALIPARAGSKRVKNKNIIDVGGHPLIAYTIVACKLSQKVNRVIVSTECSEIASISRKYGAEVPFMRPSIHSQDHSSDRGFLEHFFEEVDCNKVLLMRPTSPLRNPSLLSEIVEKYSNLHKENSFTGYRTMSRSNHSPYKMFQIVEGQCQGFFNDFEGQSEYTNLPNQSFPKAFTPNGYCDLVIKETLERYNSTFGNRIYGLETENIIDVDDYFSLDLVKFQIRTKYDKLSVHLDSFK